MQGHCNFDNNLLVLSADSLRFDNEHLIHSESFPLTGFEAISLENLLIVLEG